MGARTDQRRRSLPRLGAAALLVSLAPACGSAEDTEPGTPAGSATENLLLLVLDDVGVDAVGCYGVDDGRARTPVLDGLAREGVRFETVWANPWCSPTRATILTGSYGFRTGVGSLIEWEDEGAGLSPDVRLLPEAAATDRAGREVRTAFVGKWHLATRSDGRDHPRAHGFEHFRGTMGNLGVADQPDRYFAYDEVVDGVEGRRERYATSAVVDDALESIRGFGDDPWLVVASFHAAHMPFHVPPEELWSSGEGAPPGTPREVFLAMVEALDREIGRLLDGLSPAVRARTHVLVVGDNGSPKPALPAGVPFRHGKGTLYEFGVRVPLLVAGPRVAAPGRVATTLVNTTDLFATCVELVTGTAPADAPDSMSLAPVLADPDATRARPWILAERFRAVGRARGVENVDIVAVRGPRWKRIENRKRGIVQLYDLASDPMEAANLVGDEPLTGEAAAAFEALGGVLGGLGR